MNLFRFTFLLLISFLSCYSTSTLENNKGDLESWTYENQLFLIDSKYKIEIRECLENNSSIKESILNDTTIIDDDTMVEDDIILRKVVKRPNLRSIVRFSKGSNIFTYRVCINPSGKLVLSKLISASPDSHWEKAKKAQSIVHDYRYSKDESSECLSCGKIEFAFN